jgi:WhiB family redox-sensing transcriptional regulator
MASGSSVSPLDSLADLLERVGYPEWQVYADCADKPWSWFFGEEEGLGHKRHRPTMSVAEINRAKDICANCPVQEECLDWAMEHHEHYGVWGGLTARERERLHSRQG